METNNLTKDQIDKINALYTQIDELSKDNAYLYQELNNKDNIINDYRLKVRSLQQEGVTEKLDSITERMESIGYKLEDLVRITEQFKTTQPKPVAKKKAKKKVSSQ